MFKSYLKIAFRSLNRNKTYSLINLFGLAIGLACFVFIFLFIRDELSYDEFHHDKDRIYRIAGEYDQGGDTRNRSALTTYLMKNWLDTSFPDIEQVVRLGTGSSLVKYGDKLFQENNMLFVDPNFFEVFTFDLIRGADPASVVAQPNTAVITESIARKYFGEEDPIGKLLDLDGPLVKVTGVMKEIPPNSHFHADFVVSMKTIEPFYPRWILTNATGSSHYTYVKLRPGVTPDEIESQLADYLISKTEREFATSRTYFLQPITDIHLRSNLSAELEANSDILNIYILSAVALIILIMACINYMNLAIARSVSRAKEVGIRKVVGASRKQLMRQFLGESIITSVLALILSIFAIELLTPFFNQLIGKELQLEWTQNLFFLMGLILLSIMVGAVSGSYPAFFLSALHSVRVLKGKFIGAGGRSVNLRKALVVVQFTLSVVLLIGTIVIYNQLTFLRNKKLGVNPEQVLVIPFQSGEISAQFEQIKTELLRNSAVINVAATNNRLTSRVSNWRVYEVQGMEEEVMIPTMVVSHDFFATLQGEIVEGRDFSRDFPSDVMGAYILNESAVKFLGLESPVGTAVKGAIFTGSEWSEKNAQVIGVVKDFHLASLHTEIQATVFSLQSEKTMGVAVMAVRIAADDIPQTLSFIESVWQKFSSGRPMQYTFMDQDIGKLYHAEARFLSVFLTFATLAVVVTCLGLLGLSAYSAAQRTKEVGIRKVLGASAGRLVGLLSLEFLKLVALANLIAWPFAYFFMDGWLQNFAYRIDIGVVTFLLAAGLALLIALLTISFQTIRAAFTNPVNALRYE